MPNPCSQLGGFGDALATLDGTTIWVACASEPGAGNQPKQVLVSTDAGRSWHVRASTADFSSGSGATGTLTEGGYVSGLSLLSPATGLMSLSRGGVLRSSDGGRDWSEVALPGVTFGDAFPTTWVLDGTHAWIVLGNGSSEPGGPQFFRTSDAGVTWAPEPAPRGGQ